MKYGYSVKKNGILYAPGMEVSAEHSVEVELTNDVPEGALDTNADGSVNACDADGNAVGTVSAEEVADLQEQAGEVFAEQDKPKRGRKAKEE